MQNQPTSRAISQLAALLLAIALGLTANSAHAASELILPYPITFGTIPAATFDEGQERIGDANLVVEKLDSGNVRIFSESGIKDGARTIASAELAPITGGKQLRLLAQNSQSFDTNGKLISTTSIDHESRIATCTYPNGRKGKSGSMTSEELSLPDGDRVANVPLNLLFSPLIRGEVESVDFQVFLCRGGPHLVDFHAQVVRRDDNTEGTGDLVEVRYGPDLGAIVSLLTQALMPQLSFWFDPTSPTPWLAHRMPLYANGPEVFVVRQGVPTNWLVD